MSAYPPPTETLPIFNVNEFIGTTSTSQGGGGGGTFVNFPTAQGALNLVGFNSSGTATITNLVVNGTSDINNNINLSGDLVLDGASANLAYFDLTTQNSAFTGAGALSGSYTDANITLDTNGKITAISNGSGLTLNPTFNTITVQDPLATSNTTVISQTGSDFIITNNETASVISLVADTTEVQDLNADSIVFSGDSTTQTSAFTGAGALSGSYTNTSMTVDANGKITALANGSGGGSADDEYIAYPLSQPNELFDEIPSSWVWDRPLAPTYSPPIISNIKCLQMSANGQWTISCSSTQGVLISNTYNTGSQVDGTPFWRFISVAGVIGVGISPSSAYMWYMTATQVFSSTNYGVSFSAGVSLPSSTVASSGVIVSSANGEYVYALQHKADLVAVWRSINYGASWTEVSIGSQTGIFNTSLIFAQGRLAVSASGKYVIFAFVGAVGINPVGRIVISSDFGATFAPSPTLFGSGQVNLKYGSHCCMNMVGDRMYYSNGGSANQEQYYTSTDFGQTWTYLGFTNTGGQPISSGFSCSGSGQYIMINMLSSAGNQISVDYGAFLTPIAIGGNNPYVPFQNGCISQDGRYLSGIWISNIASPTANMIPCFYQQKILQKPQVSSLVATARPYYYAFYQNYNPITFGQAVVPITTFFRSPTSYPPNQSVQLRVSISIAYTASGSATVLGSCYTYDAIVDVFPFRLGNMNGTVNNSSLITNAIQGNTNFSFVNATFAPFGRQFWAHNIVSTGSLGTNGKIQAFCSSATQSGIFGIQIYAPQTSNCNININVEMISQFSPFIIELNNIDTFGVSTSAYGGYLPS